MATSNNALHATDWRQLLRENNSRTRWVIILFIALYVAVGLLADTYLNLTADQPDVLQLWQNLVTFQVMPYATLIMLAVAIISLLITYSLHDTIMLLGTDYREVTAQTTIPQEQQLYHIVEEMKVAAGLSYMPKVYIIEADYMNAFASGYSEQSAMLAITRGLLNRLDRREIQAVMAHELSHVRHQDIKLTLTASVLSNLMLIVIDLVFYGLFFSRDDRRERREDNRLFILVMLLRYVLPVITSLLMLYLSRTRETMADAGCVELMRDNQPLAQALIKIHNDHMQNSEHYSMAYSQTAHEEVRRAAYLYDPIQAGLMSNTSLNSLFSTHPSLEERLANLGFTSS